MINGKILSYSSDSVRVNYVPNYYAFNGYTLTQHLQAIDQKFNTLQAATGFQAVPLKIAANSAYIVEENTQVLYHFPIDIEGDLVLNGLLHKVD